MSHSEVAEGACRPCHLAIACRARRQSIIFWPFILHEVMIIQCSFDVAWTFEYLCPSDNKPSGPSRLKVCSQFRFFLHKLVQIDCWEVMYMSILFYWIGCVACLLACCVSHAEEKETKWLGIANESHGKPPRQPCFVASPGLEHVLFLTVPF